ncbi:Pls/PosA family non-ribosomal peptide synthetase [Corynebacterium sp. 335C]
MTTGAAGDAAATAADDGDGPAGAHRIPAAYLRGGFAAPERTLIGILRETAAKNPDAAALDDGDVVLTYAELLEEIDAAVAELARIGVRRGDRVGVRMPSGHRSLYVAILATMAAGCAYVPVDADDPDERADMVFGEAGIAARFAAGGPVAVDPEVKRLGADRPGEVGVPSPDDDCWIIFTSGSTGKPKGVAVTHRSAAAFVDAESRLFLVDHPEGPLGPEDRVLAGLSVAFDASCEEMWLAWAHGACLVPAPRSLVRSGVDLGPWLISRAITAVSTVPTLAGLWPAEALDSVRLLIVGGEACPAELVDRLSTPEREMWNTYGPTEATVVASAAKLSPGEPVTIGMPLDGWDLAVIDGDGRQVGWGEVGELVIGGAGLARYLDPAKDAEKYAPAPELDDACGHPGRWARAYRTGDHVRLEPEGLHFVGRVDDQVKIGGRRIELGEVEANLAALPGATQATVMVRTTGGGDKVLVGYVGAGGDASSMDHAACLEQLRDNMPAAMVPRLHIMDELPVRTSGKVDKAGLPWPLPVAAGAPDPDAPEMTPVERWLAGIWAEVLSVPEPGAASDFFALGGTSLAAATVVARIREVAPHVAVRDLYDNPRLGRLAEELTSRGLVDEAELPGAAGAAGAASAGGSRDDGSRAGSSPAARARSAHVPGPVGAGSRAAQLLAMIPLQLARGARWVAGLAVLDAVAGAAGWEHALGLPGWLVAVLVVVFLTPLGVLPLTAGATRLLLAGVTPGEHPRGGHVHLRLWAAERLADASGARSVAGAPLILWYARMLGASVGRGVDLHAVPPVTGLLRLGRHCSVEPETDLSGYWVDGDVVRVGSIDVGAEARVGARSTLLPGTRIGKRAHVEAGSTVTGDRKVKADSRWSGSPARKVGRPKHRFPDHAPARRPWWAAAYAAGALVLALVPVAALAAGADVIAALTAATGSGASFAAQAGLALAWSPLGAVVAFGAYMALTWALVRLLGLGLHAGVHPVRSRQGWQAWATVRLMDAARTHLFPLYAGQLTVPWLRALGARIGRDAEVSTAVAIPRFTDVRDGSFLADDTMVGTYELGGGWLLLGDSRIGRRAFLGNSGITAPGRKLGRDSLVAVLSSTPKKAKAGSNWWGSPPERLRRVAADADEGDARTYAPSTGLKVARGVVETLRLLAPATSMALAVAVLAGLHAVASAAGAAPGAGAGAAVAGLAAAWLASPLVLFLAGLAGLLVTAAAKWICVGRHRAGDHPLWSRFVWLNELQDAFVEVVAAPWWFNPSMATPATTAGMRLLGARIGRGVWLESYWLPETDLVELGDGAVVGPGCVVQTHLFQDRVMSLGPVTLGRGATLAAHSVALPAAVLGDGAHVGPGSLVMRGDHVPGGTAWQGNPIEPRT